MPTDSAGDAHNVATIDRLLARVLARAAQQPGRCAITAPHCAWWSGAARTATYGELARRIGSLARELRRQGLATGDPVLFAVAPGIEQFALLSALLLAGAVVVGVDPGVDPRLFAERMRSLQPRWAVADSLLLAAAAPGLLGWLLRRRGVRFPDLARHGARIVRVGRRWPGVPASVAVAILTRAGTAPGDLPPLPGDRAAYVAFTSGTTTAPKAVVHTARSIGAACAIVADLLELRRDDVLYTTQAHLVLAGVVAGATCVTPPATFDPRSFLDDVTRRRVTHAYAVPFELAAVLRLLEQRGQRLPPTLRCIVASAAPIQRPLLKRLRAVCAAQTDVWCVYAMTEMFPIALIESREKLVYEGDGDLVGTPVAGASVTAAGDGELVVRGPSLFARYLGAEAVTEHATGDTGYLDARGRVILTGRKKDMIIRGQHNIYPSLYEEHVLALAGVESCAFVGITEPERADERVVLAIEPKPGEDPQRLHERVARALRSGACPIDAFALPDEIVVCRIPHAGRASKPDRRRLVAAVLERRAHGR